MSKHFPNTGVFCSLIICFYCAFFFSETCGVTKSELWKGYSSCGNVFSPGTSRSKATNQQCIGTNCPAVCSVPGKRHHMYPWSFLQGSFLLMDGRDQIFMHETPRRPRFFFLRQPCSTTWVIKWSLLGRGLHKRSQQKVRDLSISNMSSGTNSTRNKCIASSNKCLTSSNKKLVDSCFTW